jgi:hypothetical protein
MESATTSQLYKNARDTRCVLFCERSGCRILDAGLPCLLSMREGSPNGISLDGTRFSRVGMLETFTTVTATSAAPRADQLEAALNINEHNGPIMVLGMVDENRCKICVDVKWIGNARSALGLGVPPGVSLPCIHPSRRIAELVIGRAFARLGGDAPEG